MVSEPQFAKPNLTEELFLPDFMCIYDVNCLQVLLVKINYVSSSYRFHGKEFMEKKRKIWEETNVWEISGQMVIQWKVGFLKKSTKDIWKESLLLATQEFALGKLIPAPNTASRDKEDKLSSGDNSGKSMILWVAAKHSEDPIALTAFVRLWPLSAAPYLIFFPS